LIALDDPHRVVGAAWEKDALVETTCHRCGTAIVIRFERGAIATATHPDTRLWNARHVPGRSMAGGTCGLMNLFCTPGGDRRLSVCQLKRGERRYRPCRSA
jgi:hypothetical protein